MLNTYFYIIFSQNKYIVLPLFYLKTRGTVGKSDSWQKQG